MPVQDPDRDATFARAAAQAYSPRPMTEGERWTVDALFELRRDGYRPAAWVGFLRKSLKRSVEARRARPEMVRQARRWGVVGAAGWLATCELARRRRSVSVGRTSGLLWWLSVWRMLDWHLGMAEGGDGVSRDRLSPADAVTLTRFWLVPLLPALRESRRGLPTVIVAGGLSDWLDGALARRHGRTRLGRDLDTTADLAFLSVAVVSARAAGRLSTFAASSLALRHALGTGIALGAVFGRARRPAIRARTLGAALRWGGLALAAGGWRPAGDIVLLVGSVIPPRSIAPQRSRA